MIAWFTWGDVIMLVLSLTVLVGVGVWILIQRWRS